MRKTLIALAVLGAAAGVANAQSNVTIYGIVDTGFIKKSGYDVYMDENANNRLGFRGVEDLGGGQKATFELERRFKLQDGTNNGARGFTNNREREFAGLANVGLKGDNWGAIRLGRVNELTTETIRRYDPFNQESVASMIYGSQRVRGIDNSIRFDSLSYSGLKFGATYSLGQNTDDDSADRNSQIMQQKTRGDGYDNDGYGLMVGYDNGPVSLVANWSRLSDSNNSTVWNLGGAYTFGDAKVELLYQQTKDKGWAFGNRSTWVTEARAGAYNGANEIQENQWLLGLEWKLGPGRLNASAQWLEVEAKGADISDKDVYKYAVGYTYDLSKRTALYGILAYTDYDKEEVAAIYGDVKDSVSAVQIGMTHKF